MANQVMYTELAYMLNERGILQRQDYLKGF